MAILKKDTLVANLGLIEVAAEHGAGAVGTSDFGAPRTYRGIIDGVIVTQIKVDLTGLYEGDTNGDAIGLVAGGACYIGKYDVAKTGIVFKTEMSCIELPTGGNPDINLAENTSPTIEGNGGVAGELVTGDNGASSAGITFQDLEPALNPGYSYYLSIGAQTGAAYTAGQYIITTWGYPALD